MKIAFFGLHGSFDYDKIGGTNSLVRRISDELVLNYNINVDYVLYGQDLKNKNHGSINSIYCGNIDEAFEILRDYDHIITMYINPKDAVKYRNNRLNNKKSYFHVIYTDWPESFIKRQAFFASSKFINYNGIFFAISSRILNLADKWGFESALLLPPVPQDYFVNLEDKLVSDKTRVSFIGRIDVGKGVLETLDIFNALKNDKNIELNFYGIHWENDPVAVKIHQELSKQNDFNYISLDFHKFTNDTDEMVKNVLKETDIFIQPYRKLSSSIDTPLLILEAMASLCAVITKPYGNIPEIYGKSKLLLDDDNIVEDALELIRSASKWLPEERKRIYLQNESLSFDNHSITQIFMDSLQSVAEGHNGKK